MNNTKIKINQLEESILSIPNYILVKREYDITMFLDRIKELQRGTKEINPSIFDIRNKIKLNNIKSKLETIEKVYIYISNKDSKESIYISLKDNRKLFKELERLL